ncbi:MAG: hypothetical protein E6R03_10300 [Hyphomicrobiaceae bacterium]|nr:MAG: hypothetical protein E6R03_10300 [Hyphomicrobiaceae bacterium]
MISEQEIVLGAQLPKYPQVPHLVWLASVDHIQQINGCFIYEGTRVYHPNAAQAVVVQATTTVEEDLDAPMLGIYVDDQDEVCVHYENQKLNLGHKKRTDLQVLNSLIKQRTDQLREALWPHLVLRVRFAFRRNRVPYTKLPNYLVVADLFDRDADRYLPLTTRDSVAKAVGLPILPTTVERAFDNTKQLIAHLKHNNAGEYSDTMDMYGWRVTCDYGGTSNKFQVLSPDFLALPKVENEINSTKGMGNEGVSKDDRRLLHQGF